jgi:dTDP-4-dehydrorhamnose 3,5-epimerase
MTAPRLTATPLPLPGLHRVDRRRQGDARGFLDRLFCADELASAGWPGPIAQINHTRTVRRGTLRGLHFQRALHAEAKLVSCIRGAVFDVAVDLRRDSPTYGRWHAETLSADDGGAMLLPAGLAHGFQALTDDAELVYCHSAAYAPEAEAGCHVLDAGLAIAWPLPIAELSPRDAALPRLFEPAPGARR